VYYSCFLARVVPRIELPEVKIADTIRQRSLSEWQNMTLALPPRVDAALRDAAIEIEPKTQSVSIPRRTLKTESELDAWLKELRDEIGSPLDCVSLAIKSATVWWVSYYVRWAIVFKPIARRARAVNHPDRDAQFSYFNISAIEVSSFAQ
jgi:hypothetical protein